MTKNQKQEKGITLIALIVTIIILLILAGITISAITSSGLFGKASLAALEHRAAAVEEAKNLWKMEVAIDEENAQSLEELLDHLESQKLLVGDERLTIENTGAVTIGSRTIVFFENATPPVAEPEIPDYPTTKEISCIEDLIDVAMDVNDGTNDYEEEKIELTRDLDFTNKEHYRDPDNYYRYNGAGNTYYSLDTLSVSGNDSNVETSNVYQELNLNDSFAEAPGFTQIGKDESKPFKGVFEGNGYTISNMYMGSYETYSASSPTTRASTGMFGYNEGYIYNLKLANTLINLNESINCGIIANSNKGVIKQVEVNGVNVNISQAVEYGTMSVGNTGTIYNCSVSGNIVLSEAPTTFFAGIIANNNGQVGNCNNNSTVSSTASTKTANYAAGIIAQNNGKISNCNNYGQILINASYVSGIIGCNNSTEVILSCTNGLDSETVNLVDDRKNYVSGIVANTTTDTIIQKCNNYMNVDANVDGAGILTIPSDITIGTIKISDTNNYGNINAYGKHASGILCATSLSSNNIEITKCNNSGEISAGDATSGVILVHTFKSTNTKLVITSCNNSGTLKTSGSVGAGIFANKEGNIDEVYILKCDNNNTISVCSPLAGIANRVSCNTFEVNNCTNSGNIETRTGGYSAGIIGNLSATTINIENCTNEANIINQGADASGICAFIAENENSNINIKNCTNNGYINTLDFSGAILGVCEESGTLNIIECKNTANVEGERQGYLGGICGKVSANNGGIISKCSNAGVINPCSTTYNSTGTGRNCWSRNRNGYSRLYK